MSISDAEYAALRDRFLQNAGALPFEPKRKPHKYGVAPRSERTVEGIVFDSKAESEAFVTLRFLQRAGRVVELERQPRFDFPMGFAYVADFRVKYDDGVEEVIDVKGVSTPVFKLKAKCMAHFYPDVRLTIWKGGKAK